MRCLSSLNSLVTIRPAVSTLSMSALATPPLLAAREGDHVGVALVGDVAVQRPVLRGLVVGDALGLEDRVAAGVEGCIPRSVLPALSVSYLAVLELPLGRLRLSSRNSSSIIRDARSGSMPKNMAAPGSGEVGVASMLVAEPGEGDRDRHELAGEDARACLEPLFLVEREPLDCQMPVEAGRADDEDVGELGRAAASRTASSAPGPA